MLFSEAPRKTTVRVHKGKTERVAINTEGDLIKGIMAWLFLPAISVYSWLSFLDVHTASQNKFVTAILSTFFGLFLISHKIWAYTKHYWNISRYRYTSERNVVSNLFALFMVYQAAVSGYAVIAEDADIWRHGLYILTGLLLFVWVLIRRAFLVED